MRSATGALQVFASLDAGPRERLRIALERYPVVDQIDLRLTVDLTVSSGIQVPSKRGVSFHVEMLPALIAALIAAETNARELALFGGGA